jgi:hypothetical protein
MERALGHDFSRVRIHETDQVRTFGANAIAQGNQLLFAPGKYDPFTRRGQELLGHELGHVTQQARGLVKPTLRAGNLAVNHDPAMEREAQRMGRSAAHAESHGPFAPAPAPARDAAAATAPATLQMDGFDWLKNLYTRHIYGPHEYRVSSPVYQGAPGEDVSARADEAVEALRRRPAWGPSGAPATPEGTRRFATPVGFVNSFANGPTITNRTIPWQHALHEGTVERTVAPRGSDVNIDVHGTGHGILPSLNTLFAPRYWTASANQVRAEVDPAYRRQREAAHARIMKSVHRANNPF